MMVPAGAANEHAAAGREPWQSQRVGHFARDVTPAFHRVIDRARRLQWGPALVACDETNIDGCTAALGVVTRALCKNGEPEQLGYMAVLTTEPIHRMLDNHGSLPAEQNLDLRRDEQ